MATSCEVDSVADLLAFPFSRMSFEQKLKLIEKGRPTPLLPGLVQIGKNNRRHFHASNYNRYMWLTGSPKNSKLYCWDCLLFNSNKGPWSSTGFSNLSCLSKAAVKHESTPGHLRATVTLKTFGDSRMDVQLSEQQWRAHNEKVKQNREILKRLIHTVVFMGKQELAFTDHDESNNSTNKGHYLEFLDYLSEYDGELRFHLASSKIFTGASSKMQNDIINATADVLRDAMKDEVTETPFIAVMVDETTDVDNIAQMSIVLRYITICGVKERFFEFHDVKEKMSTEAVAAHILSFLDVFGCAVKVVAQCYDGSLVLASGLHEVQSRVKEVIPQALFVHCYAHTLNLVMSQGVAQIKECKIFFSHVSGMAAFFSRSPKRTQLLDQICQSRMPTVSHTQWQCSSSLVNVLFERREELQKVFAHILEHHNDFDADTIHCANGYINLFSNFDFRFLLTTFSSIFAHSDVFFKSLQNNELDVQFCMKQLTQFCTKLERERSNFNAIYEDTIREAMVHRAQEDTSTHYQQLYCRIINILLIQVRERFKDHERLMFLALLDSQQFTGYRKSFPDTALASLEKAYGRHFDISRLKVELTVMYTMSDFEGLSPADLVHFLQQNGLTDSMHQLYLLACLVLTIPVCTASVKSTLSALKRIKTYCRNGTGQARLSTLALLSIEKELLIELKSKNRLYDQAITHFVKKNHTTEWVLYSSCHRHLVPRMNLKKNNSQLVPTVESSNVSEPNPQNTSSGTQFLQPSAIYSIPLKFVISTGPPKGTALMQPAVPGLSTTYVILPDNRTQPEVDAAINSEPVRKRVKMSEPDDPSPFDPVHVTKCLQKKLRKLVINDDNKELEPWVKSITHHFWWSFQTCDGNTQELKRRWTSILQHICGIHTWQEDGQERTCYHGSEALHGKTKWLKKDSAALKALSDLVLNFLK